MGQQAPTGSTSPALHRQNKAAEEDDKEQEQAHIPPP